MKIGKVPENVLKRSVLKQIETKKEEVISGAGIGEDCAIFSFGSEGIMMTCMQTAAVRIGIEDSSDSVLMGHLIQRCANNLAASGAQPVGIMVALTLPEETGESDIRALMADAEAKCRELNIQIAGGQTCVSRAVRWPMAAVTGTESPLWKTAMRKRTTAPKKGSIV